MAPLKSKSRYWLVALGLLSVAVACVMAVLAYLLVTLPVPPDTASPTPRRIVVNLPTAPLAATTSGPSRPIKIRFIPEEPIKGFPSCDSYGLKGKITTGHDDPLPNYQVVVWAEEAGGLQALDTTAADGTYSIEIQSKPVQRNLWVQVYQNDIPISEPVLVKTQIDCQNGYQIYQINWHQLPQDDEE